MEGYEYQEIKNQLIQLQNQVQILVNKVDQPISVKSKIDEEVDDLIEVNETARIVRLSTSTVYTKSSKGQLPSSKKDGRLHFSKKEILLWLKSAEPKKSAEETATSKMIKIHQRYKK